MVRQRRHYPIFRYQIGTNHLTYWQSTIRTPSVNNPPESDMDSLINHIEPKTFLISLTSTISPDNELDQPFKCSLPLISLLMARSSSVWGWKWTGQTDKLIIIHLDMIMFTIAMTVLRQWKTSPPRYSNDNYQSWSGWWSKCLSSNDNLRRSNR